MRVGADSEELDLREQLAAYEPKRAARAAEAQ